MVAGVHKYDADGGSGRRGIGQSDAASYEANNGLWLCTASDEANGGSWLVRPRMRLAVDTLRMTRLAVDRGQRDKTRSATDRIQRGAWPRQPRPAADLV